ncbi:MAG TPA: aspartate aminotransferase family protein [Ilumatobacteraceae bacterium]|nr:aspartate aminotransferase family protein [Ilumatobacteraceae bacterium]
MAVDTVAADSAPNTTYTLLARQRAYLLPVQSRMLYYGERPLVVARAQGDWLWDHEGKRYLDFFGGILTVSVGHANPDVVEATVRQMRTVGHTSTLYVNEITVKVAEKLAAITPGRLQVSFFTNSGTEADEMAIMAARTFTGNRDIISLRHAYAGRSASMMAMTAHANWRQGGVYDGHIKQVRSPNLYRKPASMTDDAYLDFLIDDLADFLATCTDGKIAAFMAEPIQGVGGFAVAPADYFRRIEPLVREAGGILIIDEVQTGWGRTGKHWCGIEHWGVEPDVMTFAKGIANGAPVGATVMTPEVAESVQAPTLSTFGGNPISMAQTYATIDYIERHRLWENADTQGTRLREHLEVLMSTHDYIGDVRGMGLMQGIEIVHPGTAEPDPTRANALLNAARDEGLLIGKGGRWSNVLRIAPMLNVTTALIDEGTERLSRAAASVA